MPPQKLTLGHFLFRKALYNKNDHSSISKMTNGQIFFVWLLHHLPKSVIMAPSRAKNTCCLSILGDEYHHGQQVNVYCPTLSNGQYLNLYNSKGDSITMTFNGMRGDACVASFQNGATTSDFMVSPYVSADMAKAGDYSGTLEFTVSIQPLDTY